MCINLEKESAEMTCPHLYIGYDQMVALGVAAYDAYGNKVSRVRAVSEADGGIHVKVLHTSKTMNGNGPDIPVIGRFSDEDNGIDVVEFYAFIPGGYIGPK